MNYPIWNVPVLGAGLVVAIIAVVHVLISHLAVGGGAFLAAAEIWSDRESQGPRIRQWLHGYATFFLVFTTVFGAVTGVGIWFSIQLASPTGTSLLIHQFVFAWATEWVTFIAELTLLYLYYYGWRRNSRAMQRGLALAYFGVAWLSLFIINGILTFMLTPGAWTLQNQDIAAGFFNPTYLPALFIRTLVMLILAALGGLLVASRIRDDDALKTRIIRFSSKWVIPAAVLLPFLAYAFLVAMPATSRELFEAGVTGVSGGRLEAMNRYFWLSVISAALIVAGTAIFAAWPRSVHQPATVVMLLVALFGIMGAEFFREMARKPFVIYGAQYSNGLWQVAGCLPKRPGRPFFDMTRWEPQVEPKSPAHGEWVYRLQCASCHTLTGYRSLMERTRAWEPASAVSLLSKLDAQKVMPPFQGNLEDKAALAAFLAAQGGKGWTADQVLAATPAEAAREPEIGCSSVTEEVPR